jgi:hypothetical protein
MAGGLTISTLNDSSGVLATQNGMSGIPKAWVNWNGYTSPYSIRSSFNVSSVTRNGTGDYTLAFTTAMSNANYSVSGLCVAQNGTDCRSNICIYGTWAGGATLMTTTQLRISAGAGNSVGPFDMSVICVTISGT